MQSAEKRGQSCIRGEPGSWFNLVLFLSQPRLVLPQANKVSIVYSRPKRLKNVQELRGDLPAVPSSTQRTLAPVSFPARVRTPLRFLGGTTARRQGQPRALCVGGC